MSSSSSNNNNNSNKEGQETRGGESTNLYDDTDYEEQQHTQQNNSHTNTTSSNNNSNTNHHTNTTSPPAVETNESIAGVTFESEQRKQQRKQQQRYEPPRYEPLEIEHTPNSSNSHKQTTTTTTTDDDNTTTNNNNAASKSQYTSSSAAAGCKGALSNDMVTNARYAFKSIRLPTLKIRRSKRSSLQLRWVIMILTMFIMIGNFYAFDVPAPLHQQLEDLMMYAGSNSGSSSNFEVYFNLLYTVYSFPNIILPLIGGQYVDKWGAPLCLFAFSIIVWFGQILFAAGAVLESWRWMLLGRFVFGLGGENIQVATGKLLSQWFSAEELSLAFGTVKPIGRLGSVISNVAGPMVANKYSTTTAINMAVGITAIPVFLAYFLGPIDKEAQQRCFEENYAQDSSARIVASLSRGFVEPCYYHSSNDNNDNDNNDNDNNGVELVGGSSSSSSSAAAVIFHDTYSNGNSNSNSNSNSSSAATTMSSSSMNKSAMVTAQVKSQHPHAHSHSPDQRPPMHAHSRETTATTTTTTTQKGNSRSALADAARFGSSFWLLSLICVLMYSCVLPFNNIVSAMLLERNYFRKHSDSCVLTYNDRCTTGELEPYEGNPSRKNDGDDETCSTNNYAPLLPSSLYIIFSHPTWNQDMYVYESMDESVVNCDDSFWNSYCTVDFCDAETVATEKVGRVMSIPYVVASIVSPITGYWVGNYGHRASLIAGSMFLMIVVHTSLAFASFSPILPLIGQGMAYGIFTATIWSSVPLTVEEDLVGTAYGVMTSIQNTGLAISPMFVAGLYSLNDESYLPAVELFFVICSSLGLMGAVCLIYTDEKNGGSLNSVKPKEDEEGLKNPQKMSFDDSRSEVSSVFHELT